MSFDQVTLIKNLNLIIKEHEDGNVEALSERGVCAGLVVMYKAFKCAENVELDTEFFMLINEINQLDAEGIKNLEKEVCQKYLIFSHKIKSSHVSTNTVYSDYEDKLQSLDFGVADPMALIVKNEEALIPELRSICSDFPEFFIDFSSVNHIVSLHFKDNKFSFYDPNYDEGELKGLSADKAAKEIFEAFDFLKTVRLQQQDDSNSLLLIVKLIPVFSSSTPIAYNDKSNRFVNSLLEHQNDAGYDLNTQDVLGRTLLFEAVELENKAAVKYLIENNAIHHPLKNQLSPIHQCVINGNMPILNLLLEKYKDRTINLDFKGVNLQIYALSAAKNTDIIYRVWKLPFDIDFNQFYRALSLCKEKHKEGININIESIFYSSLCHGSKIVGAGSDAILPLLCKVLPNLLKRIEDIFKYLEDKDIAGINNDIINKLTTINYLLEEGAGLHRIAQTIPDFYLDKERCFALLNKESYSSTILERGLRGISALLVKNRPSVV